MSFGGAAQVLYKEVDHAILKVNNVTKRFGHFTALDGISGSKSGRSLRVHRICRCRQNHYHPFSWVSCRYQRFILNRNGCLTGCGGNPQADRLRPW